MLPRTATSDPQLFSHPPPLQSHCQGITCVVGERAMNARQGEILAAHKSGHRKLCLGLAFRVHRLEPICSARTAAHNSDHGAERALDVDDGGGTCSLHHPDGEEEEERPAAFPPTFPPAVLHPARVSALHAGACGDFCRFPRTVLGGSLSRCCRSCTIQRRARPLARAGITPRRSGPACR